MNLFRLFDFTRLGASLLATGPVLLQLGGNKLTWWLGLAMTVVGPMLMAVKRKS